MALVKQNSSGTLLPTHIPSEKIPTIRETSGYLFYFAFTAGALGVTNGGADEGVTFPSYFCPAKILGVPRAYPRKL